jgi:VanZ family protein
VQAAVRRWGPVVAWAALIFALSSIPSLGTGLGTWDLVLRKIAHATEFAILAALLVRALRHTGWAVAIGVAYAVSDEIHQSFVSGRQGALRDVGIDAVGVVVGAVLASRWWRDDPSGRTG